MMILMNIETQKPSLCLITIDAMPWTLQEDLYNMASTIYQGSASSNLVYGFARRRSCGTISIVVLYDLLGDDRPIFDALEV
jgi:hypothetical protein